MHNEEFIYKIIALILLGLMLGALSFLFLGLLALPIPWPFHAAGFLLWLLSGFGLVTLAFMTANEE